MSPESSGTVRSARGVLSRESSGGRIFLTFDDGPDPAWTPRVLDALRAAGARATFFVVAPRAARLPGLVRSTVRSGHAVELHCTEHVRHTELTPSEVEADARCGLEILRALGVTPTLWRPPWGVIGPSTRAVARELGLELAPWTVDTHDWRGDTAREMFGRIGPEISHGSVLLLHDGLGPGARRPGCAQTVALIRYLVERARSLGCEPAPMVARPAGRVVG